MDGNMTTTNQTMSFGTNVYVRTVTSKGANKGWNIVQRMYSTYTPLVVSLVVELLLTEYSTGIRPTLHSP